MLEVKFGLNEISRIMHTCLLKIKMAADVCRTKEKTRVQTVNLNCHHV